MKLPCDIDPVHAFWFISSAFGIAMALWVVLVLALAM